MSQKTAKKKRLKNTQNTYGVPKKAKNDKDDCLTLNTENSDENETSHTSNNILANTAVRIAGNKFRPDGSNNVIAVKKSKRSPHVQTMRISERVQNVNKPGVNISNDLSYNATPTSLSVAKSHVSHALFRNNKNDVFSNITATFDSSKILSSQASSEISSQKRLDISSWGLPPLIVQKYEARGIKFMFPWQVECLANKKILENNKNLIYSAPTSAGKTLVAEFLMLKTVLERKKKALFILPFVSVVREKMFYFQDLLSDSGVRVEGFMGGISPPGGFSSVHIAIATIEKANAIINQLMKNRDIMTLGAVVIDELHLLGDSSRGYLLELLLTKLKYMTMNLEHVEIQLIGMSATLPNLSLIADWLDAELYKTDFRPIPLKEQCKIDISLYDSKFNEIRQLSRTTDITNDTDNIIQLCIETISGGHGVLIFCPTKQWCEQLSIQMASAFLQLGRGNTCYGEILRRNIDETAVQEILIQLQRCPVGLDNLLKKTVSFGVAFHHAGLTMDERDIIEGGFRIGSLKVLVATSTLSSGVNLPARRVIIRSPIFNGKPLDKLTYQQMIGRAGRMGKDTEGESILICKAAERTVGVDLMSSTLEPIESCLRDSAPLTRALLEAIASQILHTPRDLYLYSKCTFVYKCASHQVKQMVDEAVNFLVMNEFLLFKYAEGRQKRILPTSLAHACLSASIPPRDGLFLFEELQRARRSFVLNTELHLIYLVTPFNSSSQINQIDWMIFADLWRSLSEPDKHVGNLVGIEERFVMSAIRGIVRPGKMLNVHRRFFTAMALYDLVREIPMNEVCRKYTCNRGLLQSLQQTSSTFAGMVTNFCKELKWDCMELLFAQFQTRLQFGVSRDLLDLLRLPSLNGLRARSLYNRSIKSVRELANANELDVEEALNRALPFESKKHFDGETEADIARRTTMRIVFITGRDGMTARQAANLIIKEARVLALNELGICGLQWSQVNDNTDSSEQNSPSENSVVLKSSSIPSIDTPARSISAQIHSTIERAAFSEPLNVVRDQNLDDDSDKYSSVSNENLFASTNEDNDNEQVETTKPRATNAESLISKAPKKSLTSSGSRVNNQRSSSRVLRSHTKTTANHSKDDYVTLTIEDFLENAKSPDRLKKSENFLKKNLITIRTQDFLENKNSPVATVENQPEVQNDQAVESFVVSDRALDEMMQAVDERNNKDATSTPIPTVDAKVNHNKCRISAGSNCTKSPSLFSDSSFLDPQICSILEQNLVDPGCFADFEKSDFTQEKAKISKNVTKGRSLKVIEKSIATPDLTGKDISFTSGASPLNCNKDEKNAKQTRLSNEKVNDTSAKKSTKTKVAKNISQPLTWKEDSWDRTKSLPIRETKSKEGDKQSPSLLQTSKPKPRHKTLAATEAALNKIKAATSQDKSPLIGSPKSILRHRVYSQMKESPIKSVRSYESGPSMCVARHGKSDSDESVFSSQSPQRPIASKTRSRIEKKLLINTQKLFKTQKTLDLQSKYSVEPTLVKGNANCHTENDSSDSDDSDSIVLFESDDTVRSEEHQLKKSKQQSAKLKNRNPTTTENIKPQSILPINVVRSKQTFRRFREDVDDYLRSDRKKQLALELITETFSQKPTCGIGKRIIGNENKKKTEKKSEDYVYDNVRFCGVVISWGLKALYYMPFADTLDTTITLKERMDFLRDILTNPSITVRCYKAKETYKLLYSCCDIESCCKFLDPTVGDWLLNCDLSSKSLTHLTTEYFPRGVDVANECENNDTRKLKEGAKASFTALLVWYVVEAILNAMRGRGLSLLKYYQEVEMPTTLILANMELRGFNVNKAALRELSSAIKQDVTLLEEKAFQLAGKRFNFYSCKEVSQILGLVKKGKGSTSKNALKSCENPISKLVTLWRKLYTVETKVVGPLLHMKMKNNRMHGHFVTYTATGRVFMFEPNLQTVPKEFLSEISGSTFNVRMAFTPAVGNVMISADFCQLELRILAHFSKDPVLCKLLHEQGDIFKSISARLHNVAEDYVNDDMRQRAKQLCYAMIYGMGTTALAESLSVSESEAKDYLESFMGTYRGIRAWLKSAVEQAKLDGFVSTITGRRRPLPNVNSKITLVKSKAERQAVNTIVQGSAADITKKAMVLIENKLKKEFPRLPITLPTTPTYKRLNVKDGYFSPQGAYLILQLHDELIYEVNVNNAKEIVHIIKESMEHAFKLRVPLPVKIKIGTSWGNLEDY